MVKLRRWPVERRGNGHVTEVVSLREREWSCYGGDHVLWRENGHFTEVFTLMEGE